MDDKQDMWLEILRLREELEREKRENGILRQRIAAQEEYHFKIAEYHRRKKTVEEG